MSDIKNSDFAPSADPTSATPVPEKVAFETSDLRESSIETLGSYMLSVTERNYYHEDEPIHQSTPDDPGILGTQALTDIVTDGPADGFFAGVQTAAAAYYATITDGSTPDAEGGGTFGPLTDFLDKTSQTDGHHLLGSVVGNAWTGVFQDSGNQPAEGAADSLRGKVSAVLQHNRFSPGGDSPYIEDQSYSNGMFSLQNTVGRFDEDANSAAFKDLANIAFSMMLTATGASESDSNPNSADSTNAIGQGLGVQLALSKVPINDLYAKNAHGFPGNPTTLSEDHINQPGIRRKGTKTEDLDARNAKSYGQLNSYLEPFDGPLPVGMIILAVLAAIAVLVAGVILAAVLTLIFLLFPPGQAEEPPEPLPLGASSGNPDFGKMSIRKWLMRMLRLPEMKSGRTFIEAMFFGVIQFYFRITDAISSGYFIIVSRAAIRDLEQISDAMAEADFSNIVGGLESIFIVLDAFATSTTFQFLNTVAKIGDIVILSGGLFGGGDMEFSPAGSADGQPDNLVPAISTLHKKSRTYMDEENPDYRLAWRFGSLPSRYILPSNVIAASSALGVNAVYSAAYRMPTGYGLNGEKTQKFGAKPAVAPGTPETAGAPATPPVKPTIINGRYSADERQTFEDTLDAYYIPFYLQDLRTNELLAMHTFVESLQDSFAPEYSNVSGFGRMDDVKIYKKTKRSMGLSFYMIATGPADQDELYYAVNKLVTMVYPQWSKGTIKKDGTNTFIMPFSQVPTASPVVRLRLGELWSSNYSLQSMSRLFGLGTDSFTLDGVAPYGNSGITTEADMASKIAEILAELNEVFHEITLGEPPYDEAMAANLGVAAGGLMVPGVSAGFAVGAPVIVAPSRYKKGEWDVTKISFGKAKGKLNVKKATESARRGTVAGYVVMPIVDTGGDSNEKKTTRKKKRARIRYAVAMDQEVWSEKIADTEVIICGHDDLAADYDLMVLEAINNILGGAAAGGIPNPFAEPPEPVIFEAAEALKTFFGLDDPSNNSLVRAFEESGGKGIAGVITNLDFDWNIAPWDERPGNRAPTYVKVTMGFDPIHDIPLGLDYQGGIRAPAYSVGSIVRGLFGSGPTPEAMENNRVALIAALKASIPPPPPAEETPSGE
jgi:hypothetical protein